MVLRKIVKLYGIRRNLRLKASEIEKMQSTKLKEIISHAYHNVPFYHAKFRSANLKPDDIHTLEDLKKIPITTKSEIRDTPLKDMIARNVNIDKCLLNRTSGSTGIPFVTLAGKRTLDFEGAAWLRAFLMNGFRLSDKRVIIKDPAGFPKTRSFLEKLGIMRRKYISIFEDIEDKFSVITKESPDIIESYPSSLVLLADFCKEKQYVLNCRLIFTLAEQLDKASRKLIESTFKAELFDYYGTSELSLMAWECRGHMGYHINVDSLIMEFVNDGMLVAPGERGEIVSTSLVNHEMPLIRYCIGDVGIPIHERCSCGVTFPIMKVVEGRNDDFLLTTKGQIISPCIFSPYPFENLEGIKQFRIIQVRRDKLIIQLVVKNGFLNNEGFEKVRKEIRKVFGEDMQVGFQIVDEIERDPSGKLRKIISRVPVSITALPKNNG